MKLLLGSNNKHKADEIKAIFASKLSGKIELITLGDVLEDGFDVDETGETLEENAILKAEIYHKVTGLPCIADDTGLEIDTLAGAPGVMSARYAGEHGNDAANRAKVLEKLAEAGDENRTAQFRTVICYYGNGCVEIIVGKCEGKIISEERGESGFGYDPIFVPDGFDATFAEMPATQKNAISHRGRAVEKLVEFLKTIIEG